MNGRLEHVMGYTDLATVPHDHVGQIINSPLVYRHNPKDSPQDQERRITIFEQVEVKKSNCCPLSQQAKRCKDNPRDVIIPVIAICNLPCGTELLRPYGAQYWRSETANPKNKTGFCWTVGLSPEEIREDNILWSLLIMRHDVKSVDDENPHAIDEMKCALAKGLSSLMFYSCT